MSESRQCIGRATVRVVGTRPPSSFRRRCKRHAQAGAKTCHQHKDQEPDSRCQHEHDPLNPGRKCDSRCNEGSAHPWERRVAVHREEPPQQEYAHAWCLPMHYTGEGWNRMTGPTSPASLAVCARCGGEMARFPR